jgi:hypothetical protein
MDSLIHPGRVKSESPLRLFSLGGRVCSATGSANERVPKVGPQTLSRAHPRDHGRVPSQV